MFQGVPARSASRRTFVSTQLAAGLRNCGMSDGVTVVPTSISKIQWTSEDHVIDWFSISHSQVPTPIGLGISRSSDAVDKPCPFGWRCISLIAGAAGRGLPISARF
jgi:hypothetical protein